MRQRRILVVMASAAAVCGAAAAAGAADAGTVSAVSGAVSAATSFGEIDSVSCASPGNCAAGGTFDGSHGQDGFVAAERNGRWGSAIAVPGLAALSNGGGADLLSVSCTSAGNCAAGGSYFSDHRPIGDQGFVAVERNGRWGRAIEVPGLGALNKGDARVVSVSCTSAGNCAAGGSYLGGRGSQGFVVTERDGRWHAAIEVPGLGALSKGADAEVNSVSCASARNCAAGGDYWDSRGHDQGWVAVERNGRWRTAIEVPGLAALNKGLARVNSVSCALAGDCAAGGYYLGARGQQGFVAVERHGRWRRAIEVPGLGALNTGRFAEVNTVSCPSAGNCAAGGFYRRHHEQGFVAVERDGRWRRAIEVPGLAALNRTGYAQVDSVSCASAGNCAAGGIYADRHHKYQGFVVAERNGRWRTAVEVPGLGTLNKGGDALVRSVSCASACSCAAGGFYLEGNGNEQGFVTGERNGRWGTAIQMPGLAAPNTG